MEIDDPCLAQGIVATDLEQGIHPRTVRSAPGRCHRGQRDTRFQTGPLSGLRHEPLSCRLQDCTPSFFAGVIANRDAAERFKNMQRPDPGKPFRDTTQRDKRDGLTGFAIGDRKTLVGAARPCFERILEIIPMPKPGFVGRIRKGIPLPGPDVLARFHSEQRHYFDSSR
jgi:hypothetical protein